MNKSSKFLISLFIILLCVFVGFAIFSYTNLFPAEHIKISKEPYTASYSPTEQYVRPIGRTVLENDVRWCSFSGSGIEFDCLGESVEVTLLSDTVSQPYSHKPRVAVLVNDNIVFDEILTENEQSVSVNLHGYTNSVVIRIIKQSESMFSSFGIGKITANERRPIKPTKEYPLKIEFIGDSITAGYGIDEENYHASFSTATENFSKTYAYLTAKELKAQYSAVAFSGYGVLSGATSGGRLNSDATIFKHYEKAITNKKFTDNEDLYFWNNTKFNPDFVVINLGTNDASYCSTVSRRTAFSEKYYELLTVVREKNPDAFIICVLGDVNNSVFPSIKTAIEKFKADTGENKITSSIIRFEMGKNDIVIDGHPGELSNISASYDLIKIIRTIIETGTYSDEPLNKEETTEEYTTNHHLFFN